MAQDRITLEKTGPFTTDCFEVNIDGQYAGGLRKMPKGGRPFGNALSWLLTVNNSAYGWYGSKAEALDALRRSLA